MTRQEIVKVAKGANKNPDIKWSVLENKKNLIAITNNYDTGIRFEIRLHQGEGNDIKVTDENGWKNDVGYLLGGSEWFDDFSEEDKGIEKAIKMIVRFFYNYY